MATARRMLAGNGPAAIATLVAKSNDGSAAVNYSVVVSNLGVDRSRMRETMGVRRRAPVPAAEAPVDRPADAPDGAPPDAVD